MESCNTCRRGSAKFLGDQWCEECREVLCKDCEIAHSINKQTLDHHLTTYDPTKVPTAVSYAKSHELKVREDGSVECMTQTDTGEFLIFDDDNREIILYDPQEQCIKGACAVTDIPENMATIPGTTHAVLACYYAGTYFMDYSSMKLGKKIYNTGSEKPHNCVTIIDDKLVVGTEGEILLFSISGQFLRSMDVRTDNRISGISKGPNNTFICIDGEDLFCIDEDGKELWFYNSVLLDKKMTGCFVDYNYSIYAASKENCGIHQLTPDGMLLNDDVLDEKCDQYKVTCYKKDGSEIYFCNSSPIFIVVYKRK